MTGLDRADLQAHVLVVLVPLRGVEKRVQFLGLAQLGGPRIPHELLQLRFTLLGHLRTAEHTSDDIIAQT